jgi:glycosyltransferase involved in cell wall biosynthesis
MFTGLDTGSIVYTDPWVVSFEERFKSFSTGERRIAYFYEAPDTSTFRYRVFNMVEALEAAPELGVSGSWFTRADLPYLERFIDRADALVICRTRFDADVDRMILRARARGIRVFFDVDDLVFDPDYIHLILDALGQPIASQELWDYWFAYVGRIGATLRLCDAAIVTNDYLAGKLQAYAPQIALRVVPNFLNRRQQTESERIFASKRRSGFARDGRIHIGYFSGTPSHNRDFQVAVNALCAMLETDPRVVLRTVGFLKPEDFIKGYSDRIEVYPLQDFLNLQGIVGEVEINIAPLLDNSFTNCKSELKYFEAAIAGTLTVSSPSFTIRNAIRDGENGFLANAHEWELKLPEAIQTVLDPPRYIEMAERAFHEVRRAYAWDGYASQITAAVFGDVQSHAGEDQHAFAAVRPL